VDVSTLIYKIGAVLLAIVLAIGGYKLWEHKQQQIGAASQRAADAEQKITQLQADLDAANASAKETQRRIDAQQESQNAANKVAAQARADAAAASAAADSMRKQLDTYVATHRGPAPSHPAIGSVSKSQPGADPLDLLSELYSRSDEAAGAIAQYADDLRRVGEQCDRDYGALTAAHAGGS
jgi:hypothetical protein